MNGPSWFIDNDVVIKKGKLDTMKANTLLSCRTENGSAVIDLKYSGWLMLIGASCKVSITPMTKYLNSISFAVPEGQKAVIAITAVHVLQGKHSQEEHGRFLIPVFWKEKTLMVDLEQPFVPHPDRLGQITCDEDLLVWVGEQKFIACPPHVLGKADLKKKREKLIAEGYRVVDDPNLLCRYMVGQATVEDLKAAATLDRRSQVERELAGTKTSLDTALEVISQLRCKLVIERNDRDFLALQLKNNQDQLSREGQVVREIILNQGERRTFFGFLSWVKVRKLEDNFEEPAGKYLAG